MNDLFDSFGNGSSQDNLDLTALRFFAELDRQTEAQDAPSDPPAAEPVAPLRTSQVPDEEVMPDLADNDMDSVILSLMAEPGGKKLPPRGMTRPLTRPVPKKKAAAAKAAAPAPAEKPADRPLSDLAMKAARLFDALPAQDQLLAFTLLEKLSKAAEGQK